MAEGIPFEGLYMVYADGNRRAHAEDLGETKSSGRGYAVHGAAVRIEEYQKSPGPRAPMRVWRFDYEAADWVKESS